MICFFLISVDIFFIFVGCFLGVGDFLILVGWCFLIGDFLIEVGSGVEFLRIDGLFFVLVVYGVGLVVVCFGCCCGLVFLVGVFFVMFEMLVIRGLKKLFRGVDG